MTASQRERKINPTIQILSLHVKKIPIISLTLPLITKMVNSIAKSTENQGKYLYTGTPKRL